MAQLNADLFKERAANTELTAQIRDLLQQVEVLQTQSVPKCVVGWLVGCSSLLVAWLRVGRLFCRFWSCLVLLSLLL